MISPQQQGPVTAEQESWMSGDHEQLNHLELQEQLLGKQFEHNLQEDVDASAPMIDLIDGQIVFGMNLQYSVFIQYSSSRDGTKENIAKE